MIEKIFVLLVFVVCVGLMLNLFTRGAFGRRGLSAWHRLRDWPAERRRRAYLANEFRSTRKQSQPKSRSTLDH
jgi:hypothetical protein